MSTADATLRMVLLGEDRSASKTVKGLGTETEKTGGKLKGMGKIAAGVFAGGALFEGAQKGIEFLKGSVEASVQEEQANAVLARQLKNTTGATDEQVKSVEEWITKTAEASGTAKSELTPALTKLATVTGSVTKAQKLTTLAQNVSAGTHQKLSSVVSAFVKAQNGSVGGLARLGVATKDADGKTKSFTEIQKEMAKQFKGDTAAAADTAAGRMKRLGITWEEMKVQVGNKLLPVLTTLAGFVLNVLLPNIGKLASFLSTKLGPPIEAVVGFVKHDLLGAFTTFQTQGPSKFAWVSKTMAQVVAIFRQALELVKAVIHTDLAVIGFVWKHFGSVIVDQVRAEWTAVQHIISGALKIIQGVLKVFTSIFRGDWKGAWDGIKMILSGAWTVIKAVVKLGLDTLKNLMHAGLIAVKVIAKAGLDLLMAEFRALPGQIMALGGLMLKAGKALMGALFNGIVAAAKAGAGFAGDIASTIVHDIINVLNNTLPHTLRINKGPIHVNVPLFPMLAKGGIVTRPTMALIGEAGPEAVIPLSGAHAFGGSRSGGDLGTFTLVVKGPGAAEQQTMLLKLKRERGGLALGLA